MNKSENEMVFIGGAFLLAPIVGCAVALPLFMLTRDHLWPIVVGTVFGMATYVAGCWLHTRSYPNDREAAENQSPEASVSGGG